MKRIALLSLASLFFAGSVFAQDDLLADLKAKIRPKLKKTLRLPLLNQPESSTCTAWK